MGSEHPRPEPDEWRTHAACKGWPPKMFCPEPKSGPGYERYSQSTLRQIEQAKRICDHCPVVASCFAYGMTQLDLNDIGIYGGLTVYERRKAAGVTSTPKKAAS